MALSEDSPPFAVLQQSAEDFKSAFEEDITKCLATLNSKITALMCDPDSLGGPGETKRGNTLVEFSMAKYGILASMKSFYDEIEKGWLEHLAEMKAGFIENVQIFLANTKLEVKLPLLDASPRPGIRRSPASSKAVKQDKSPSAVSSIYPKLINTAKHIPGLSSFLPNVEYEDSSEEEKLMPPIITTLKSSGRTPKRVTISTSQQYMESPGQNGVSRKQGILNTSEVSKSFFNNVEESEEEEEEEEEKPIILTPLKRGGRGRKSIANTPASAKKETASKSFVNNVEESEEEEEEDKPIILTPLKRGGRGRKSIANTPASAKKETVSTPLRKKSASNESSSSSCEERATPLKDTGIKGRRSIRSQPSVEAVTITTPGRKTRTPRKKANGKGATVLPDTVPEDDMETNEDESELTTAAQKTPKQVHFSLGLDVNDDLEIYSPDMKPTKSASRRKTMVSQVMDNFSDICLTPEVRGKTKRKTIAGNLLDQSVAPSPKRLKRGGSRSSLAPSNVERSLDQLMDSNLLESEGFSETGQYSPWIPLENVGGKVPALPGIYELKVAQAKKPAYIGACDSLRHKLTLHKLVHNSGHKHLDKFIERNKDNILVRYEHIPSSAQAKAEEKNRVKDFVAQFKTTPAYN